MSRPRALLRPAGVLLSTLLAVVGCERGSSASAPHGATLSSETSRVFLAAVRDAPLSPELQQRIGQSPHALLRFVNRAWTQAVCVAFGDELRTLPAVRLHGDAHLEQYAVTTSGRGLDDFDDSATGPAVVDLVRFLGSVELTAEQRGWHEFREAVADAFFDGYRKGLEDPTYLPSDPAIVRRLRAAGGRSPDEFLSWAESLMRPLPADDQARLDASWPMLEAYARRANPSLAPNHLHVKRVGWLRLGIGSALSRKVLARVEGPSAEPDDDVIVEGKEVLTLAGIPCLSVPTSGETFRVVEGVTQVGRLKHRLLVVVPIFPPHRPDARGWWVKSWETSYRELEIADFASARELIEVAHDVGAQLGSSNLLDVSQDLAPQKRLLEFESVTRLEPRIRQVADDLARAVLEAWQQVREP